MQSLMLLFPLMISDFLDEIVRFYDYFLVLVKQYGGTGGTPAPAGVTEDWQKAHFKDMFDLITLNLANSTRNIILNRAHLGEYVYSPIYRGYEGNWVFDLEESFLNASIKH
jgi:hypothetical protein